MLSQMISSPRRASAKALQWINDNPLPTAGVTMAVLASGYLLLQIQSAASRSNTTVMTLDPTLAFSIASERPAYLLAIIVGVGMLAWRE